MQTPHGNEESAKDLVEALAEWCSQELRSLEVKFQSRIEALLARLKLLDEIPEVDANTPVFNVTGPSTAYRVSPKLAFESTMSAVPVKNARSTETRLSCHDAGEVVRALTSCLSEHPLSKSPRNLSVLPEAREDEEGEERRGVARRLRLKELGSMCSRLDLFAKRYDARGLVNAALRGEALPRKSTYLSIFCSVMAIGVFVLYFSAQLVAELVQGMPAIAVQTVSRVPEHQHIVEDITPFYLGLVRHTNDDDPWRNVSIHRFIRLEVFSRSIFAGGFAERDKDIRRWLDWSDCDSMPSSESIVRQRHSHQYCHRGGHSEAEYRFLQVHLVSCRSVAPAEECASERETSDWWDAGEVALDFYYLSRSPVFQGQPSNPLEVRPPAWEQVDFRYLDHSSWMGVEAFFHLQRANVKDRWLPGRTTNFNYLTFSTLQTNHQPAKDYAWTCTTAVNCTAMERNSRLSEGTWLAVFIRLSKDVIVSNVSYYSLEHAAADLGGAWHAIVATLGFVVTASGKLGAVVSSLSLKGAAALERVVPVGRHS
eukprot:TRINITY_DN64733_c0_g1_i1.p1 TRINITY_DN64733_c0_g1~~TRINITY_DN64733_c0_g1_i1.p1  ORF type:complete len:539 (-),score=57.16 TRINITY_DN64733_c0_g1_i1:171-1787(-)